MSYKAWKAFERRHARDMGGERLWREDYGDSAPDGESETDVWDCKAYQSHACITMFVEAFRKYKAYAGDRRFHLALFACTRPRAGDFVLLTEKDFEDLLEKEKELARLTTALALGDAPYSSA